VSMNTSCLNYNKNWHYTFVTECLSSIVDPHGFPYFMMGFPRMTLDYTETELNSTYGTIGGDTAVGAGGAGVRFGIPRNWSSVTDEIPAMEGIGLKNDAGGGRSVSRLAGSEAKIPHRLPIGPSGELGIGIRVRVLRIRPASAYPRILDKSARFPPPCRLALTLFLVSNMAVAPTGPR